MKKTPEEIIQDIREACESLGWDIAMKESSKDGNIYGLVIGETEYVEEIIEQVHDVEEYIIYPTSILIDTDLH